LAYSPSPLGQTDRDNPTEILEARSAGSGGKYIFTRRATEAEKLAAPATVVRQFRATAIQGWTLFHLPNEDISPIEKRAKENTSVWAAITASSDMRPIKSNTDGIDIVQSNKVVSLICNAKLEYHSSRRSSLTYSTGGAIPARDFCRDYMLILAANGIVVRKQGDVYIEDFEFPEEEIRPGRSRSGI
jgi:hypothetical protein